MSIISLAIHSAAPPAIRDADYGAPKTINVLDAGTVWAVADDGTLLVFWYLETNTLLSLVRHNELTARVLNLCKLSPWCYLILDGAREANGWPKETITSALVSIQEAGAAVLHVESAKEAPVLIQRVAGRKRTTKRVRPARDVLFFSPGEDMLLAIRELGSARLDALLAFAGNSTGVALALLTDPTVEIPGVPRRVQENARAALGLESGERLAIERTINEEAIHDQPNNNGTNRATTGNHHQPGALVAASRDA